MIWIKQTKTSPRVRAPMYWRCAPASLDLDERPARVGKEGQNARPLDATVDRWADPLGPWPPCLSDRHRGCVLRNIVAQEVGIAGVGRGADEPITFAPPQAFKRRQRRA